MASTTIPAYSSATVSVLSGNKLATSSVATYRVDNLNATGYYPNQLSNTYNGSGVNTTSAYSATTSVLITAGGTPVLYNQGVSAAIPELANYQPTPGTLNATGTLTAALIMGSIVTSSTAAAVVATLDTGTVMDAAATFAVGDSFDWTAVNTGAANAFTVTAATGHTIVGAAAVALSTSGRFRTTKTAANTFITYRMS
jgi:hypothetical protein